MQGTGPNIHPDDLVGTWEVAQLLGWSTAQVSVYARTRSAGMPAPIAHLRMGRIWIRSEIEQWARARGYVKEG